MTRYSSDSKQRRSKRYIALHEQLKRETIPQSTSDSLSKAERHRKHSAEFRAGRT